MIMKEKGIYCLLERRKIIMYDNKRIIGTKMNKRGIVSDLYYQN